jgi:glutathionylspermidine amidase/synthetase
MDYGLLLAISVIALLVLICVYVELPKPFGTPLGSVNGVIAYSAYQPNGPDAPNLVNNMFTGLKWQCVEFARRYLIVRHGITFQDVANAYELYSVPMFLRTDTSAPVSAQAYSNGARKMPAKDSLLIYSQEWHGTGHVAVITQVTEHTIVVAEQNRNNISCVRCIPCSVSEGRFTILDNHVIGWVEPRLV